MPNRSFIQLLYDRLTTGLKPTKFSRFLAILGLVLLVSGCGAKYHLRKLNYHRIKAESKGAVWSRDTVWQEFKFTAPAVTNSLTVKFPIKRDTSFITQDSIVVRWFPKVVHDTVTEVQLEIRCPEKDVEVKVPVAIDNELQARGGIRWWWLLIAAIVGVVVGGILVWKRVILHKSV